jgi:predicted metal-dependent phosphoesterase TrpH
MSKYVDLHMHTYYSDGTKSPEELISLVRDSKVDAFSITDHDTLDGYKEVKNLITDDDPELISGVELSVSLDDGDMHILAYCFDDESQVMNDALLDFQKNRKSRGQKIVNKLNNLDIKLDYELVEKESLGSAIGRPHVAKALLNAGLIKYYEQAFEKYIGDNGPAYVPKENFTPKQAIDLIHEANGVAVLAHPGINNKDKYLELLVGLGLDGIEVYHSSHKQSEVDRYKHLAERYRIIKTGGSDYHGYENRHGTIGSMKVPYEYFEILKQKANNN